MSHIKIQQKEDVDRTDDSRQMRWSTVGSLDVELGVEWAAASLRSRRLVLLTAFIRALNRFVYCKRLFQSDAYLGIPDLPSEGGRERQDVTLIAEH